MAGVLIFVVRLFLVQLNVRLALWDFRYFKVLNKHKELHHVLDSSSSLESENPKNDEFNEKTAANEINTNKKK